MITFFILSSERACRTIQQQILTIKNVDKKFQMSNILSAVVMVSAFLLLYAQAENWTTSFTFNTEKGKYFLNPNGDLFNNGYRYLNWLIDVPMLLFQMKIYEQNGKNITLESKIR